jgi:hypothetical protein
MRILVGLENHVEGRSLAWALEHPGCFAYGANQDIALTAVPRAVMEYFSWAANRSASGNLDLSEEIELVIADTWDVYSINDHYDLVEQGYEVNAWFWHDWKPLSREEVDRGLALLAWSRADLLESVHGLDEAVMHKGFPGERWSIAEILGHVGSAEWWYLDRLGLAFPRQELPDEPLARLSRVRQTLNLALPALEGKVRVGGKEGEIWSPRKLLRRAMWHERDHTQHIHKLLGA